MYAYFDGDNIGDSIELLLMNHNIDAAKGLSLKLNVALEQLKNSLNENLDLQIILYGGDDLLIEFDAVEGYIETIESARREYFQCCGHYISCGSGNTLKIAMENLRKAKLIGRNHFLYNDELVEAD